LDYISYLGLGPGSNRWPFFIGH